MLNCYFYLPNTFLTMWLRTYSSVQSFLSNLPIYISIQNKLAEAISDLESLEMFEERDMVIEHRNNLDEYLIWANHTT